MNIIHVEGLRFREKNDRGRRTDGRGQRTEDGGRRTEDRGQRTEDRGQRTEVGSREGTDVGGQRSGRENRAKELVAQKVGFNIPVFIDSPLGLEITKIYSRLSEYWDKEAKELKAKGDHPIDFKNLYSVERFRDHKRLLEMEGPAIVIAGSGMCTGGRIVEHLKERIEDSRNDIFFVGYQAKGTAGRDILKYPKRPGRIKLVHGEIKAQKALGEELGLKD